MEKKLVRHSLKTVWGKAGDLEAGRQLLAVAWVQILTLPFTSRGSWSKLLSLVREFPPLITAVHTYLTEFLHLLNFYQASAMYLVKLNTGQNEVQTSQNFHSVGVILGIKKHLEEHLAHSTCPRLALKISSCGASRRSLGPLNSHLRSFEALLFSEIWSCIWMWAFYLFPLRTIFPLPFPAQTEDTNQLPKPAEAGNSPSLALCPRVQVP